MLPDCLQLFSLPAMNFKRIDRIWLLFTPTFLIFLGVDQVSKWWALTTEPSSSSHLGFDLSFNNGIIFGIEMPLWLIYILYVGLLSFSAYLVLNQKMWRNKAHLLALGLILAGGIGNLIDRVRLGYVVDFIKIYWWPTFNLADVYIFLGVVYIGYLILVEDELLEDL